MSEMHRPQWLPHLKVVEHEHQEIVLFQLLPSPHQGREERYVRWWHLDRLFQGPPPEEVRPSFVFPLMLRSVPIKLSHTFFSTCITSIQCLTSNLDQYGRSKKFDFFFQIFVTDDFFFTYQRCGLCYLPFRKPQHRLMELVDHYPLGVH